MNKEEAALQDAILKWLSRPDVFIAQVNRTWGRPQGTATTAGFPDLVVMCNGHVELWELKSRRGRRSRAQVAFGEAALRCGVTVHIIRSFEDASERIEEMRRC